MSWIRGLITWSTKSWAPTSSFKLENKKHNLPLFVSNSLVCHPRLSWNDLVKSSFLFPLLCRGNCQPLIPYQPKHIVKQILSTSSLAGALVSYESTVLVIWLPFPDSACVSVIRSYFIKQCSLRFPAWSTTRMSLFPLLVQSLWVNCGRSINRGAFCSVINTTSIRVAAEPKRSRNSKPSEHRSGAGESSWCMEIHTHTRHLLWTFDWQTIVCTAVRMPGQ